MGLEPRYIHWFSAVCIALGVVLIPVAYWAGAYGLPAVSGILWFLGLLPLFVLYVMLPIYRFQAGLRSKAKRPNHDD